MSFTTYYNSLSATVYDGNIGTIRLRWSTAGRDRIYELSQETGAPAETIKALTEHVVYASAYRLGNQQAVIRGPPHKFSVDSRTGAQHMDADHVSCELSGGTGGRSVTHIYLAGVGDGVTAYDNVQMAGESVTKKKGGKTALDPNLSYGNYTTDNFQNMSRAAPSSLSGHADSSSSGATGQTEWVWYEEYQKWYHPGTQQWQ